MDTALNGPAIASDITIMILIIIMRSYIKKCGLWDKDINVCILQKVERIERWLLFRFCIQCRTENRRMACERDPALSISISMNRKTCSPPRCSWKKRRFGAWCITCSIAAKCLDCCWMFECREESSFLQKIFQKFSYKVPCLSVLDDSIDDDLSADDFPESLRDECTIRR